MTTRRGKLAALGAFLAALLIPAKAHAYVGPGAGIAIATTALAFLVSIVLVLVGLLLWPVRFVYRLITRKRPPKPAAIDRAVVIGLDGLDPDVCQKMMDEGKLPTLSALADMGMFRKLSTTYPAMSPVAWSTFATGVNPAKHGIFDFLTRDPNSYQPDLSSAEVAPPKRHINIGKFQIPISKPEVRLLRKSKPFWELLGKYRVPCCILRVPITFPPEKFDGSLLSAMCVPDLQGSQGTFSYYSSAGDVGDAVGGKRFAVTVKDGRVNSHLEGPPNPIRRTPEPVVLPFSLDLDPERQTARLRIGRERVDLRVGEYSDWIPVAFPLGLAMKLRGICRFRLLEAGENVRLYVTPINIDPDSPILPISHPRFFAIFLAKLLGRYATLGLAEDTWALNEGVIDEDGFLEQAWANHEEREAMFFEMLDRTPRGVIACVFDGTDRIQHMFMRYSDEDHPALAGEPRDRYRSVIEDTYARMDAMIARVLERVDPADARTLVAVLSDHGFKTFRRGVNVNTWLLRRGYLVLEDGRKDSGEWLQGVDWTRTRAFAMGLGGIFLNIEGRESQGIVAPDQAPALADEIAAALTGLVDPEMSQVAIQNAYASHSIFKGPYAEDAPDVIVGYAAGWRASWEGVRGLVDDTVFSDNTKAWSGDHCIDPELVPGVLFCNRALDIDGGEPHIADMAPTILDLFGVPAPRYMDGRSLTVA